MAADACSSNPCCAELKRKYEAAKISLKQAYDLAERKQNAIKEEKLKAKLEKEAKEKEIATRKTLENEIHELKAQMASLLQEIKTLETADKSGDELRRVKQLLEEEKKKTLSEKVNATNAWNLLKLEKDNAEEERRLVHIERARANELRGQLARRVEEEKQKTSREKRRADTEKAKLEEQKKCAEREKTKAIEEKSRADSLLKKLEEEREKTKDLFKKLEDERKSNKGFRAKLAVLSSQKQKGGFSLEKEDLNVKLLKEKLKLRKAQLKHGKNILKLEESKNNVIKQELSLLKQDFMQISSRFKVLDSHLNIGGTSDFTKVVLSVSKPVNPLTVTTDPRVFVREGGAPHISRESQSRPASGTSSESLPPNRQNFAFFSDKKLLMGPQDRERDTSVSSPLLQNQENTGACTKSSLENLKISRKRKRKKSSDSMKKVRIQNVNNDLNPELAEFEKMVREGGVLKLLEFENEGMERRFKSAIEGFLSPNLPKITPREKVKASYKGDIDHLVGKDDNAHLIPKVDGCDLKSSSNLLDTVTADEERHERSQCLNENGKTLGGGNEKHSYYFLIVSSKLNENSIKIIGGIWKEITTEESSSSQMIDLASRVLQLASKSELVPEEKVYVICSLLASEICQVLMSHSTDAANLEFDKYISSFADKTCSVLSGQMLHLFTENSLLEITTSLLEDFLICKQVLVYRNGVLCSTISTKNQFISSCIIFASICARTDRLDLIRGTVFKILLEGKSNISRALISAHVFANICGERLFGTKEHRLLENALCWVVHHIEKGGAKGLGFAPCQQCPFGMEAAAAEGFVDSLLDEVEACSLLKQEPHFVCDQHCSTYMAERNELCYFTEIISLLELVGSYMAWECAYNKVVRRLLKMLESCRHEEFAACILVLIGHLSRCGVNEGGYNQIQVSELRDKLSNFIQTKEKIGLALQFACIGALLYLVPLKFKQISMGEGDASSDNSQFNREICQIKNWFSGLSEEQKVASQSLFMG